MLFTSLKISPALNVQMLSSADVGEVFQLIDTNRDFLRVWLPFAEKTTKFEDTLDFVSHIAQCNREGSAFAAGIRENGQLVGVIGVNAFCSRNRTAVIGYWLAQKACGRGIMTQCVQALTEYLIRQQAVNAIHIDCAVKNFPSRRIPERLGFTETGLVNNTDSTENTARYLVRYELTAAAFEAAAEANKNTSR